MCWSSEQYSANSYNLSAALNLTVGGRYFDYNKSITGETTVGFAILGAPLPKADNGRLRRQRVGVEGQRLAQDRR